MDDLRTKEDTAKPDGRRRMTERKVDSILGIPGLFDAPFIPKDGPLWVRWLIANSSVYEDFTRFLDAGIERIRTQYRTADEKLRDTLAGQENALLQFKQQVDQYVKEERDHVAFSEKRQ